MRANKYGASKTVINGQTFDSKKEANRWGELLILERAGNISDLKHHESFPIEINGVKVCRYESDFTYLEKGKQVVEDVKSPVTRKLSTYRLKKKLMLACHGIEIQEV